MRYQVYDTQTKDIIGDYASVARAHKFADKLDLEYGAIRYGVRLLPNGDQVKMRNGMMRRSILSSLPLFEK